MWAIHNNTMRFLPNFFERGQLAKIFICFPDPHFKRKNHRKRIVTPALCAEYSYALRDGGLLYAITDVAELMEWMVSHLTASPLFERLPNAALRADPAVAVLPKTDEGLKVRRNNGNMFIAVYRKRLDPLAPRPEPPLLGNDVAAAAAADAGYKPVAASGGEDVVTGMGTTIRHDGHGPRRACAPGGAQPGRRARGSLGVPADTRDAERRASGPDAAERRDDARDEAPPRAGLAVLR